MSCIFLCMDTLYGAVHALLGGSRALLALILPPFFAFVLIIDFSSIFFDFGGVLEGFWDAKMVEKSIFLVFFGICLWRPQFFSNFDRFLIKLMVKIIRIFNAFSLRRFINCFLNLLISSMLET